MCSCRYYNDTETGWYYLQSRYYDPVVHRFINADSYASTDATDAISCNMFAYCNNNPVNNQDPTGTILITTLILIGAAVVGVGAAVYTGVQAREAGCDWADTIFYALGSGLCAFCGVYSLGMTAYGCYECLCYLNGKTPVTEIGSTPAQCATPENPLKDITYSDKVTQQQQLNDYHSFPDIVDNYGSYGQISNIVGGDGLSYSKLQILGTYKGVDGYFTYIWNSNGVCNHRMFEVIALPK